MAQVAMALQQHVLLRQQGCRARALLRANGYRGPLASGLDWPVQWCRQKGTQVEQTLPDRPIAGRLLYVQLSKHGFRPIELYLFSSLVDPARYPLADVVALYGLRWSVEIDYRQIKSTLDMAEFSVQTAEMFRKELAVGALTYNLICATLVQAAVRAELAPNRLSFVRGLRRVRDALLSGVPAWVLSAGQVATYLLERLAQCRLQHQPHKLAHEPRQVRRRPQVYPALKGDRDIARQQVLAQRGWVDVPTPGQAPPVLQQPEAQQKAA